MGTEWGTAWRRRWRWPWHRPRRLAGPADARAAGAGPPGGTPSVSAAAVGPAEVLARWRAGDRGPGGGSHRTRRQPAAAFERGADPAEADDFDWVAAVDQARRDWEQARRYFECVTDRDLVDQAIHLVLAAEKRYAYLLKQARMRGIRGLPPHPGEAADRRVAP